MATPCPVLFLGVTLLQCRHMFADLILLQKCILVSFALWATHIINVHLFGMCLGNTHSFWFHVHPASIQHSHRSLQQFECFWLLTSKSLHLGPWHLTVDSINILL